MGPAPLGKNCPPIKICPRAGGRGPNIYLGTIFFSFPGASGRFFHVFLIKNYRKTDKKYGKINLGYFIITLRLKINIKILGGPYP